MSKILLTGNKGFIGRNIQQQLEDLGNEVVGIDPANNTLSVFDQIKQIDWHSISYIFHLGAESDTTNKNINQIYEHNIKFSINLLDEAILRRIPFRYASSASVYGTTIGNYINPLNYYALSKATFDYYVQEKMNSMTNIIGFRYFNVYGYNENKPKTAMSPVSKFSMDAISLGYINLFRGSENIYRDFVSIDDVVDVTLNYDLEPNRIYDVGTSAPISFEHVAELVAEKYQATINLIPFPEYLKNKYQYYTCARPHIEHKYISVEDWLKKN